MSGPFSIVTVVALAALPLSISATEDPGPDRPGAQELVERAFYHLYADDYVQTMELTTMPRGGRGITRELQVIRRQSKAPGKALVRFTAPADMRRTAFLVIENPDGADDLYVYLPAIRMTRHLAASQRADSFFGTDLSYEDVEPKSADDYIARWRGWGEQGGSTCAEIEIRARQSAASTYDSIVLCVEIERGVALSMDFYRANEVVKRLEVDPASLRSVGERVFPFRMVMTDRRRRSSTAIVTRDYDTLSAIPDSLFSTWNLEVGNARRDRARARENLADPEGKDTTMGVTDP